MRVPRWLILLLLGLAGTVYLQERVLPPRLPADESERLQTAFQRHARSGV